MNYAKNTSEILTCTSPDKVALDFRRGDLEVCHSLNLKELS